MFEEIASFSPKVNTVLNPLSFSICCGKQLGKQALRFPQTGFAKGNRFCFAAARHWCQVFHYYMNKDKDEMAQCWGWSGCRSTACCAPTENNLNPESKFCAGAAPSGTSRARQHKLFADLGEYNLSVPRKGWLSRPTAHPGSMILKKGGMTPPLHPIFND